MAPFSVVLATTGIARIMGFVSYVVGFFALLGYACFQLLSLISGNINVFWTDIDSSLFSFVSYVLNFNLLYLIFTFYYFIFCTFVITFIIQYCYELFLRFIPNLINVIRVPLQMLTWEH